MAPADPNWHHIAECLLLPLRWPVMHVRCPYCHNAIETVEDAALTEIFCSSCGSSFNLIGGESTTAWPVHGSLLGHFELVERVGIGKFGSVWKARDTQLQRTVAVKIPRKEQLDPEEAEMFFREARAAAQLRHPSIVSVHEVGRENGTVYIASDYVLGANLREWLSGKRLTPRESAELCAKIADALDHAHEHGVIHRDLKPGNIMMDMEDQPHLLDFGLAKRESGEITMTLDGHVLGTPAYMPPEQARGEGHGADRRSDVYSAGVILYELLTGEVPFRGDARMLVVQILRDEPPPPRCLNLRIPRDLQTICLKCLEKDPVRRYQAAAELAKDLRRFLRGEPIVARRITVLGRAFRWSKRNPTIATLAALALISLLGGLGTSIHYAVAAELRARDALKSADDARTHRQRADRARLRALRLTRAAVRALGDEYTLQVLTDAAAHLSAIEGLANALVEQRDEYVTTAELSQIRGELRLAEAELRNLAQARKASYEALLGVLEFPFQTRTDEVIPQSDIEGLLRQAVAESTESASRRQAKHSAGQVPGNELSDHLSELSATGLLLARALSYSAPSSRERKDSSALALSVVTDAVRVAETSLTQGHAHISRAECHQLRGMMMLARRLLLPPHDEDPSGPHPGKGAALCESALQEFEKALTLYRESYGSPRLPTDEQLRHICLCVSFLLDTIAFGETERAAVTRACTNADRLLSDLLSKTDVLPETARVRETATRRRLSALRGILRIVVNDPPRGVSGWSSRFPLLRDVDDTARSSMRTARCERLRHLAAIAVEDAEGALRCYQDQFGQDLVEDEDIPLHLSRLIDTGMLITKARTAYVHYSQAYSESLLDDEGNLP